MVLVPRIVTLIPAVMLFSALISDAQPATGPLRICQANPRYFTEESGKAIYLTGSHTWPNLVDLGPTDPPPVFDYNAYLDFMQKHQHNFMRMWTWELTSWDTRGNKENQLHTAIPHPWARSGSGKALDGKPKFNLKQYDPAYFDRLRARVTVARDRGIYVSIMLFEGWGLQFSPDAWKSHPFNRRNNVNGIDGDKNQDGMGLEVHELVDPKVTALQEAYVKKVVDTVNDLDNVLYEISNENHPPSTSWQYHFIDFIHQYEKSKPKQHPVGMTFQYKGGSNKALFDSPAEWIAPNDEGGYRDNPPAGDGRKVILNDTDHLWGMGGNPAWVWKSFLRGLNPLFMDPYDAVVLGTADESKWEPIRKNLGYTLRMAKRMALTEMVPKNDLASSGYCLANPGKEYLVFLPNGESVTVDLSAVSGSVSTEWFNPQTGETQPGPQSAGGEKRAYSSPFGKQDTALYLKVM